MQLCYVDESGTTEMLVRADQDQQPVVVVAGVSLPERDLTRITHEWIDLKTRFHPEFRKTGNGWLDAILKEVKGAKLRKGFRDGASVRQRKRAIGMLDGTLKLLERHDAKIVGRIWVKRLDREINERGIYGSSLQFICRAFDSSLPKDERGMVVVDSQTYRHNHQLAHSVFTQRFAKEPKHLGLVDMPVFGHSDNHAGLQIADLLCSAILAPIACSVYAGAYETWNRHCASCHLDIRERFGSRLKALTFPATHPQTGFKCSSLLVHDPVGKRGSSLMYGLQGPQSKSARKKRRTGRPSTKAKVKGRRTPIPRR